MNKQQFHPQKVIENLDAIYDVIEDSNLCFEELSLEDTFKELKEMVSRFIPKKPNGSHYQSMTCPTCKSRVRSGSGSSAHVRDDRCRKCGQVIDWSDFPKY